MQPTSRPSPRYSCSSTESDDDVSSRELDANELTMQFGEHEVDLSKRSVEWVESLTEEDWSRIDEAAADLAAVHLPSGMNRIPEGLGALPHLEYIDLPHPQGTSFALTGKGARHDSGPGRHITLNVTYEGRAGLTVDLFEDDELTYTGRGPGSLQAFYFTRDGEASDRFIEIIRLTPPAPSSSAEQASSRHRRPTLSLIHSAGRIEMGQGLIVHGPARIVTSPLTSCSLICGVNRVSGQCGAFHYPAMTLKDREVRHELREWLAALAPSAVHVAMAPPARDAMEAALLLGNSEDQARLVEWVGKRTQLAPTTSYATHPQMSCDDADFTVAEGSPFGGAPAHDLQHLRAGQYEDSGGLAFDIYGHAST